MQSKNPKTSPLSSGLRFLCLQFIYSSWRQSPQSIRKKDVDYPCKSQGKALFGQLCLSGF